jgi:hypothetical protein
MTSEREGRATPVQDGRAHHAETPAPSNGCHLDATTHRGGPPDYFDTLGRAVSLGPEGARALAEDLAGALGLCPARPHNWGVGGAPNGAEHCTECGVLR